jgi:Protein tyrosine/serine phosphatase
MKLSGGINFRDMGGYATTCGRRIKKNRLYRSGALSKLTKEDTEVLSRSGIKHIIDYRDVIETKHDGDVLWEGVHYECCPANPSTHTSQSSQNDFFSNQSLEALPKDFMESLYMKLPFANKAYQALFQKIQGLGHEGGIIQHCAVGKDRTGVGSALVLMALDVPKETVLADYAKTEEGLMPFRLQLLQKIEHQITPAAREMFEYMMSARPTFLQAAFGEIEKRYSNWDDYFHHEIGMTAAARQNLKNQFLE